MTTFEQHKKAILNKCKECIAQVVAQRGEYDRLYLQSLDTKTYTPDYIQREIMPKMDEKRRAMAAALEAISIEAERMTAAYLRELNEAAYALNGADLNEDAKLLNAGITLNAADLEQMYKRNTGNNTMQNLVSKYAKEHGVNLPVVAPYTEEEQAANGLLAAIQTLTRRGAENTIDTAFPMFCKALGVNEE